MRHQVRSLLSHRLRRRARAALAALAAGAGEGALRAAAVQGGRVAAPGGGELLEISEL